MMIFAPTRPHQQRGNKTALHPNRFGYNTVWRKRVKALSTHSFIKGKKDS